MRILAMDADGEGDLYEQDLSDPVAFVFGNEAWGLPKEVAALADATVRVPITGRAESLNLAAAATVCLFEWERQRREGRRAVPETAIASVVKRVLGTGEQKIKVRGIDDLMVFRARCCNPIRGEKIVGYISRGKGVSVHSATCSNVVNLLYDPERRIDVEWDKEDDPAKYIVRLSIQVEDRKGILADISAKIAGIDTNIKNVDATSNGDNRGNIRMTVEISDVKHLQKVIKSLRSVDGVDSVVDVAAVVVELFTIRPGQRVRIGQRGGRLAGAGRLGVSYSTLHDRLKLAARRAQLGGDRARGRPHYGSRPAGPRAPPPMRCRYT